MIKPFLNIFSIVCLLFLLSRCSNPTSEKVEPKKEKDSIVEADSTPLPKYDFAQENDSLVGIKFKVDDVVKNKKLLETFSAPAVVANFIGKKLSFSPDSDTSNLVPIHGNGLMNTIYLCYAQHRPLVLSPDVIWMTIAQGVSTHINKEFKKLEPQLFTAKKPKEIEVRNDSLDYGAKYWQQLIASLSDSTRKYTQKDMHAFLAPKFSTTTQKIFTAYESNILYAYKKAFTYIGGAGCGIPYITITGTKEDWVKIKEKLILLDDIGLGYWRIELEPVVDEFIAIFDKKVNTLFWKNIYKEYTDYGEHAISGWIIKFFPYKEVLKNGTEDKETGMYRLEHDFEKNEFLKGDRYLYSTLNMDDFPTYKSEAKIIYRNYYRNETTNMYLYSGIMAAKQFPDGSLQPWVTWGICSEKEPEAKELYLKHQELVHQDPEWIPFVYKNDSLMDIKATYSNKKNLSYEESILSFKEDLKKYLGPKNKYQKDTLTFYILANGKTYFITKDKKKENEIQCWIDKNGIQWNPSKMKWDNIKTMNVPKDKNKLVKVNSKFEIIMNEK